MYAEQYVENLGDKFYVAWVGGEDGCTTLDTLVINLDKNQNGALDEGEAYSILLATEKSILTFPHLGWKI